MYELIIQEEIDIFHKIIGEEKKIGILHEHHLLVDVAVELPSPDGDFHPSRQMIDLIESEIKSYDSANLNELPEFAETRFLIEDLARVMHGTISAKLAEQGLRVSKVEIGDYRGKVKIVYHNP